MTAAHEARALRDLVRAALCPAEAGRFPPLDHTAWARATAASLHHGLGPLLYAALEAHPGGKTCPEAVRERLRQAYLVSLAQAARRGAELGRVLASLAEARIPTLVLKGAALAETVYPDPVLRPMHDADLLVRPADRPRARAGLLALGYEDESNGPEDFVNPATGLDIDLHTELINGTRLPSRRTAWRFDLEGFWARAITGCVAGVPVLVPDPVDHFVYLAQHLLLHHGMAGPLRLADLLALGLRLNANPGWEAVAEAARRAGANLALYLALLYLRDGFGQPVPAATLAAVKPAWPRPLLLLVRTCLVDHRLSEEAKFLFAFLALPSWKQRAGYLREILLPASGVLDVDAASRRAWRRRMAHAGRISYSLWGAARRALLG